MRIELRSVGTLAAFALIACSDGDKGGVTAGDVAKQAAQTAQTAAKLVEQTKDDYARQMRDELDLMNQRLNLLKERAAKAEGEAKAKVDTQIEALTKKVSEVEGQLEKLKTSSGEAWKDMKGGIESALNDLKTAYDEAKSNF